MSQVAPPFRRLIQAATTSIVIALGVVIGPSSLEVPAAYADDEAPVKAGATLVARGDCEVQKVTITRGAKVQVTAATAKTADIALPDGYVLRRVPLSQLRYFFDVAR
jgi:hypothetical protein